MTSNQTKRLKAIGVAFVAMIGTQAHSMVKDSSSVRYTNAVSAPILNNAGATISVSTTQTASYPRYQSQYQNQPSNQYQSGQGSLASALYDADYPTNINYAANKIEFVNPQTLGSLYTKWHSGKREAISIAHFGDSHIQTGWQIAAARKVMQEAYAPGGRGMIFPYAIAKTYSQEDYTSTFTGKWRTSNSIHQPPKIPLGISGFVAVTTDNAFSFNFKFNKDKPEIGSVKATLHFKAVDGSYAVTASNGVTSQTIFVSQQFGNPTQKITFDLPNSLKDLQFSVSKQSGGAAASFELHGVDLANMHSTGLIYHNLGVGGANFKSIVQQKLFDEQFANFAADLVVLDWGTNDILYTNAIAADLESTIRRTIRKVREHKPNAAILLTSAQEARYKGKPVTVSREFAALVRRIAQEEGCLYYDWYQISGGGDSVHIWKNAGYASKDTIHLNGKGYRIRGKMLATALVDALNQ